MLRFKVGEKVRVVENTTNHRFNIGKIVTIDTLCCHGSSPPPHHYYAVCGGGEQFVEGWFVNDEDLEPIVEEKAVEEFKLEVGHIVVDGMGAVGVVFSIGDNVKIGYIDSKDGSWVTFDSVVDALMNKETQEPYQIEKVYQYGCMGISYLHYHTLVWEYDNVESERQRKKDELNETIRAAQETLRLAQEQLENL